MTFEDLGNLIEKCRSDFGVDIEIDLDTVRRTGGTPYSAWHCAIGTIHYDRQDRQGSAAARCSISRAR